MSPDSSLSPKPSSPADLPSPGEGEHTGRQASGSEDLLRLLVESAKDYAIFLLDLQGCVASWNVGAERIKGYKAGEIVGRHFSVFYTAEDLARGYPEEELRVARAEGRYEDEGWRIRQDGSRFFANVVITALFDQQGELRGYSKITRDVTVRRQMEEERLRYAREQVSHTFLREILFSVTEGKLHFCATRADLPPVLDSESIPFPVTRQSLARVRRHVRGAALAAGLSEVRSQDLLTAAAEASMNAVVHAQGGSGRISASRAGTVQVRIEDGGAGIDMAHLPRATLERGFTTAGSLGHGFWLMLQTCDRLWLLTGAAGTTVVLEQDRQTAEPQWLTR